MVQLQSPPALAKMILTERKENMKIILKKYVKENILRISDCLEGNENKINLEFVDFNLIFYDFEKNCDKKFLNCT